MDTATTTATAPTSPLPTGAVVVGVDGSEGSDRALAWAVTRAATSARPLIAVHAIEPYPSSQIVGAANAGISVASLVDDIRAAAAQLMDKTVESVAWQNPDVTVLPVCVENDARSALIAAAEHADVLVVGSRGRGPLASLLLGSVGVALVREAPCPVAVVRPVAAKSSHTGVLVGMDGTTHCLPTVEAAFREAARRGVTLSVVHCTADVEYGTLAWSPMTAADSGFAAARVLVSEGIAGMREKFPEVSVEVVVGRGDVLHCLLDLTRTQGLVVVGRHGRSAWDRVGLGAMATALVERAGTTVLVVP